MSAIAGVVYLDERPASAHDVEPARRELAAWGPDGGSTWSEGGAAVAHLAAHATPGAASERWPLRGARGEWLIADARLDNRQALMRALRLESSPLPTDGALILAAHERWGDDAPAHLVGDFAYVLGSPSSRPCASCALPSA